MPSHRQCYLIAALCGVGSAVCGTAALAFQFPPLSDGINPRQIHSPDAWAGGGFQSSGGFNSSPAEFGPASGMWQRSPNGNPASGDSFPLMTPGPLPGGLSPDGFNSSGMFPPVNQPAFIANNPMFGGKGQQTLEPNGPSRNTNGFGPNGVTPTGTNTPPASNAPRVKPKVSWALNETHQPFVGLLGQVARPGVYEIERKGTVLGDLLQNIGGLAKDASGQFRVIRNGRPGQMTSYSGAAQFELMPGDLIVADARPSQLSQRAINAKQASGESVQVGFVNLIDRPVVLKLKSEHANVSEILSIMRQDQGLASQVKIVVPASYRGHAQPGSATPLVSETVLIFPPSSVKTDRIAMLPEPYMLKRESGASSPSRDATPPTAPRANLSPDVTQVPRSQPSVGAWSDSTPLPQSSQPISRSNDSLPQAEIEAPAPPADASATFDRGVGVRGAPRRPTQDQSTRDSEMTLAPPAEEIPDNAPAPPPLLKDYVQQRHVSKAKENDADKGKLTADDLDDAVAAADKASSGWSIWPLMLTAGVGLLALIGFGVSLRRRSPVATSSSPIAMTPIEPSEIQKSQSVPRRDLLDAIIDNQLPLTEERVSFASPIQFHGRPQPPKTIRMDQRHPLPKPHSPVTTVVRGQGSEPSDHPASVETTPAPVAPRTARMATQKIRIDRNVTTGVGPSVSSMTRSAPQQSPSGSLDRALSAVQKQTAQKREEHDV